MSVRDRWPWILAVSLAASLVAALAGCDSGPAKESVPPAIEPEATSPALAWTESLLGTSESGAYRVEIRPEDSSSARDTLHSWLVRIETVDGRTIVPGRLAFSGGMPQHGHGFPSAPHVRDALADGWFRVGGIRFHMAGEWTLRVEFVGPDGPDVAIFQVDVPH